ncbi:MAG: AtpZ/AtpI family protein [Bacteroidota bacterium]
MANENKFRTEHDNPNSPGGQKKDPVSASAGLTDEKKMPVPSTMGKSYIRFSGLAFQMLATIGLACWGGIKLDAMLGWKTPIATVILSLAGVGISMYVVIKDLSK